MLAVKIVIKVAGMTSSHCVNTVTNLITDERGVKEIQVFLTKGIVEITGDERINRLQILNAINLSGVYHAQ